MNDEFKVIEKHLINYDNYKLGIKNMKRQLDNLYPRITATYDDVGGGKTGAFMFKSQTEDIAMKRIERSCDLLRTDIEQYELVVHSIDEALKHLDKMERKFVDLRYFHNLKVETIASRMKYSKRSIYVLKDKVKEKLVISLKHLLNVSV